MISPASSSNSTASTTTSRSTPTTRAHTLFDCTPFALALFPALDSRKAKPGNGVHPRMLSYPRSFVRWLEVVRAGLFGMVEMVGG
jgi:hypothetical protein